MWPIIRTEINIRVCRLPPNGARALSTWLIRATGLAEPWGHQLVTEGVALFLVERSYAARPAGLRLCLEAM